MWRKIPWVHSSSCLQSVCVPTLILVTTLPSNAWIVRCSHEFTLEPVLHYQLNQPKNVQGVDALTQAPVQHNAIQYNCPAICTTHCKGSMIIIFFFFWLNQIGPIHFHVWSRIFDFVFKLRTVEGLQWLHIQPHSSFRAKIISYILYNIRFFFLSWISISCIV